MALSTRMCRNSPSAQSLYTVLVHTWRYTGTSLTVSSVRNLSAESSVNGAKTCESLESAPASSRVVARGCEALLLAGTGSSGLRSRGPQVPLPAGASNARRWAARIWRLQAHDPRNNPPRASSQRNAPTSSLPANGPDLPSPNCLQNWGAFARTREDK